MINFATLFNSFRGGANSPINDLIDQPETDLNRLLDEDSFVSEYKSGNNKVMNQYGCFNLSMKYEKMSELINYVTVVGPAEDKKKGYKFPLAACQILSSENSATIDFFFPNGELYAQESMEEEVEVEEEEEIVEEAAEEAEKPKEEAEDPKTVIEDQLENMGDQEVAEKADKEKVLAVESKMDEEPKKKTRMVKKLKTVTKTVKKEVEPLASQLFSYFSGEINYTLAGYISKILISFFNKKPLQVLKYVLDAHNFDHLLNHVESRSVGEFITKVMTYESLECLPEREQALRKILAKLSLNDEIYVMSNLSACTCEIIEKVTANAKGANSLPEFCNIFFLPEIVIGIINNVISAEQNVSVYNAPILLTYLTNAPLVLPENKDVIAQFKELLSSFVEKAIEKLKINKDTRRTVGVGRVKIMEILSFVMKENVLESREIVASNKGFFSTIIELCKNYQFNNILHNEFLKIINVALSEESGSPLLRSLLEGDTLLNFILEQAEEDEKIRAGCGSQKNRKGYIGHIISICRSLQEHATKNPEINGVVEKPEFENVLQNLVNKDVFEYNKNLAGYSLKKGALQTIMFMKEEIIQEHIKFLTESPPPVYEPEPELINIEHPDLEDTHKIDVNQMLKEMQENPKAMEENEIETVSELSEDYNPKYWISHMDYNLDDLMDDL